MLNQRLYGGADSVGPHDPDRRPRFPGRRRDAPALREDEPVGLRRRAREHRQPARAVRVRRRAAPGAGLSRGRWSRPSSAGAASPTRRAASPSTGCALPPGEARTRYAAALAGIDPRLSLRSADEIARRFSKAPAPYRVFVILTLVVMEVSVINLMRDAARQGDLARRRDRDSPRARRRAQRRSSRASSLEGVIVSMAGSALGLALAIPTVAMFDRLIPDLPVPLAVTPAIVCTVAAGLPARQPGERHLPGLADRLGRADALPGEDMNPSLELGPILRSMRHHKGAFSLLVLEVALGFVMLTHTLIVARYYFRLHVRPTGMPEEELVVARRRFLHPRDVDGRARDGRARTWRRSGAPARRRRRRTPRRCPTRPRFRRCSHGRATPREHFAWPMRATPGIVSALGLQLIAGDRPRGGERGPEAGRDAGPADRDGGRSSSTGRSTPPSDRPSTAASSGAGRVAGVVRDFAFRRLAPQRDVGRDRRRRTGHRARGRVRRARPRTPPGRGHRGRAAPRWPAASSGDAAIVVKPLERDAARFSR